MKIDFVNSTWRHKKKTEIFFTRSLLSILHFRKHFLPSDPTAAPRFYFRAYTSARCRTLPENVTPQRHRIYKYSQPVHGHIRGVPGAVLVIRERSIESIRQLGGFFNSSSVAWFLLLWRVDTLDLENRILFLFYCTFCMELKDLRAVCVVLLLCVASTLARE